MRGNCEETRQSKKTKKSHKTRKIQKNEQKMRQKKSSFSSLKRLPLEPAHDKKDNMLSFTKRFFKEPTSLPSLCVCVLFCYDIKTLYLYHITMYVPNLCEFTDFKNPLIILFSEITYPII